MVLTSNNTDLTSLKRKRNPSSPVPMDTSPIQSPIPLRSHNPMLAITQGEQTNTDIEMKSPISNPRSSTRKSKKRRVEASGENIEETEENAQTQGEAKGSKKLTAKENNLVEGFAINSTWCEATKFKELMEILEQQKWVSLLSTYAKSPLIPEAMKEFCKNFACVDNVCSSKVNGTRIEFDASYLEQLFGTPNRGFDMWLKGQITVTIDNVDEKDIVGSIGGDSKVSTSTSHNCFSPLQKLLFNIVWRGVVPRTQKRNIASLFDACLMYCLERKIPINFPAIMIKHLSTCIPKFKIPYSSLLTEIFKSFSVDLSPYFVIPLKSTQILQLEMLHLLNLKVVQGKVIRAGKEEKQDEEDQEGTVVKEEVEEEEELEQIEVPLPRGNRKSVGKRKSMRVAMKENKKRGPVFMEINEEGDVKEMPIEEDAVPLNQEELPETVRPRKRTPRSSKKSKARRVPSEQEHVQDHGGAWNTKDDQILELKATVARLVELQEGTDHRISSMQAHIGALVTSVKTLQNDLHHYSEQANATRATILTKINNLESFEETVIEETAGSGSPSQA